MEIEIYWNFKFFLHSRYRFSFIRLVFVADHASLSSSDCIPDARQIAL